MTHLQIERVQFLRPVKPDGRHTTVAFQPDR